MALSMWDSKLSTSESNRVLLSLSLWHLSQVRNASVHHDDITRLIFDLDVFGLCHYELSYETLTPADAYHLRQVLAFFQKRGDLDLGIDTQATAWKKFVESEQLCAQTNDIFRKVASGGFSFPLDVESVLFRAQRKIANLLGDVPSLERLKLRFGPGATTQVKRKEASARRKLSQKFCCSGEMVPVVTQVLSEMPLWSGLQADSNKSVSVPVDISIGRIHFVRKNAKTDRTINVEPALNSMVQLGIGDFIASRLRSIGIDIKDQSRNQKLAQVGSITGALATLDLSSASDTVSIGLVQSLLPVDWWYFLSWFRTGSSTAPDGSVLRFQKFSSMGNGFTFPLETLIFWALSSACVDESEQYWVSVYGDDIVVPTCAVPLLSKVLTCCGFLLNSSKSFSSGPFRESCGKDYLRGIDIRPCYIKDSLSASDLFILHNFYVRRGFAEPTTLILREIDESLYLWGPDGFGDGHLLGDFLPNRPDAFLRKGWGGFTFETYTWKSVGAFYRLGADYVYPGYSVYVKGEESDVFDSLRATRANDLFRRRYLGRNRVHGQLRPERSDARYEQSNGRKVLRDTLPGVAGYKRIKIYVV